MKNKFLRFLSLILVFSMIFSLTGFAYEASNTSKEQNGYVFHDNTSVSPADTATKSAFSAYGFLQNDAPALVSSQNQQPSIIDEILSHCTYERSMDTGASVFHIYSSDSLAQYLFDCSSIKEISLSGDFLYIYYYTTDNKEVILCYNADGLHNRGVYNPDDDSIFFEDEVSACVYSNARNGSYYEMSPELEATIDDLILAEEWDALSEIEDISVVTYEDGTIAIEPRFELYSDSKQPQTRANGFTSESALLADLRSDFPMYSKLVKASYSKYCSYLGQNVAVRVKETRNAYTKKTANFSSFAVGTAVSIVGLTIGVEVTIAAVILTSVGIGISFGDFIESAVSLCKSAVYKFTGKRDAYVYDSTTYNTDVNVHGYWSTGEFTGGYDSSGNFTWVISTPCSAFNHSYADLADRAIYLYNANLVVEGFCTAYYPD